MTKLPFRMLIFVLLFNACKSHDVKKQALHRTFETTTATTSPLPRDVYVIEIVTDLGRMKAVLYNETPLHRDNMVKLIDNNFFDGLLFHRVIKNFVIQGGDPDSRNAAPGVLLGDGGNGYTIPAEFMPLRYFHKKGVLAAARDGDDVNPAKASSGCQFYIVQGKIHDDASLEKNERRINRDIIKKITDSILSLPENNILKTSFERIKTDPRHTDSLSLLQKKIDDLVNPVYRIHPRYRIPDHQRAVYKKIGGTPHLDTHYTVFGEVVEGLDVLDKLILAETDSNDRPKTDIRMQIKIVQRPEK